MSLNKEIKELDAERLADGEKSRAHYNSVDLPGTRTKGVDADAVRKRIAEMNKQREMPNHE